MEEALSLCSLSLSLIGLVADPTLAACPAFALQRVSGSSSCLSNSPALAADPSLVNGFSSDQRIRKQCPAFAGTLRSSVTVHRHDASTNYSMGDMHRRYPIRYEGCARHLFPIWAVTVGN